jgi:hypothetical protein
MVVGERAAELISTSRAHDAFPPASQTPSQKLNDEKERV